MKLSHGLIACLSLGVVAYVGFDLVAQRKQLAETRTSVASLSRALDEAQRDSAAAARNEARARPVLARAEPEVARAAAPEDPDEGARPAPTVAQAAPEIGEVRARLDQQFANERADADWAGGAQKAAADKFSAALPASSELHALACRASMCKMETVHQDMEHYQRFLQDAFMKPGGRPWNGGFFSSMVPDPTGDKLVMVSYLAREGEELPRIE